MTPSCQADATIFSPRGGLPVRAQIVLGTCACVGASAFLFAVNPSRHAVYPECLLYRTTGFYCAGCGATRALYALLHGHVLAALHDNGPLVLVLPFVLGITFFYAQKSWRRKAWPELFLKPRTVARGGLWIFLAMLLFTIVRNLPGPAFDFLKPLAG
jgi:hypothetical protein